MRVLISRVKRFLNNDSSLPGHCYNKWFFNDVYINCQCKQECIYKNFTISNWFDYSDSMYKDYVKQNISKEK